MAALPVKLHTYDYSIVDNSLKNPFLVDDVLLQATKTVTQHCHTEISTAEALYRFVHKTVRYGEKKSLTGYRTSLEVLYSGEGLCGEMAILYVTMARCAGLTSQYVSVTKDNFGKKVNHACAGVFLPQLVLADPAYNTYNIAHKIIQVNNDLEVQQKMQSWRK